MSILEDVGSDTTSARTKWVSVYIGVLAVLLAICAMGGDNVAKDANRANIDASNTWAFFQAKNIRRAAIDLAADDLNLRLQSEPSLEPAARGALEAQLAAYKTRSAKLTSEPEKREGLDELYEKAKEIEAKRDAAFQRDPYFDWSQALLQIAIVLASISLVGSSAFVLYMSGLFGGAGLLLLLDGFTMLVPLM